MSNLPNPNEFKNHKASFSPIERTETGSKGYDLVQMDKSFKYSLKECDRLIKRELSNELISYSFWKSNKNYKIGKYHFCRMNIPKNFPKDVLFDSRRNNGFSDRFFLPNRNLILYH